MLFQVIPMRKLQIVNGELQHFQCASDNFQNEDYHNLAPKKTKQNKKNLAGLSIIIMYNREKQENNRPCLSRPRWEKKDILCTNVGVYSVLL